MKYTDYDIKLDGMEKLKQIEEAVQTARNPVLVAPQHEVKV